MRPLTQIRVAAAEQREAIVDVVHSAYRGESSRRGWTTEADLLDGQRTDVQQIDALIADPQARLLLALAGDALLGTVLVRWVPPIATLGMLAVTPDLQRAGLGSRLLAAAEGVAKDVFGAERIEMSVIDVRRDIIAYYLRRGYRETGRSAPFPYTDPRFGVPRVSELAFTILEKAL
jgi:GNAT superfamily N-acetyltransferase